MAQETDDKLKSDHNSFIFDYRSAFKYNTFHDRTDEFIDKSLYKSAFTYNSLSSSFQEEYISEEHQKESWLSAIFRRIIVCIGFTFLILLLPISICFCIKKVHALERLVVLRLGQLQPAKGPGLVVVLPWIDRWIKVSLRSKKSTVSTPQILTADGAIVETSVTLHYQICNVVHYVIRLSNPHNVLENLVLHCMKNIISEKLQEDIEQNRESILSTLKEELNTTTIKWGLEISDVILNPVKILKPAEQVNAFDMVVAAIKAAVGHPNQLPQVNNPLLVTNADSVQLSEEQNSSPKLEADKKTLDITSHIKHFADIAVQKGDLKELCAVVKFEIVDNERSTVFCTFERGNVTVVEGHHFHDISPNISVMLSEKVLQEFLNFKVSPLQAYLEGKVTVTGDWKLLNTIANAIN